MLKKILPFFVLLLLWGCGNDDTAFVPKPHAYPKVNYPKREKQHFAEAGCPYEFDYPAYAKMIRNTEFMGKPVPNDCWYDMYFSDFDAKIHLTYYPIPNQEYYDKLLTDVYRMANEHTQKANFIDEIPVKKEGQFIGKLFDISGPAATPLEFYLTDEDKHFIRGSLYLNTQIDPDSLAPIYQFLKDDAVQIINTFVWK